MKFCIKGLTEYGDELFKEDVDGDFIEKYQLADIIMNLKDVPYFDDGDKIEITLLESEGK